MFVTQRLARQFSEFFYAASGQGTKVFDCLRSNVTEQAKDYFLGLSSVNGYLEIDAMCDFRKCSERRKADSFENTLGSVQSMRVTLLVLTVLGPFAEAWPFS